MKTRLSRFVITWACAVCTFVVLGARPGWCPFLQPTKGGAPVLPTQSQVQAAVQGLRDQQQAAAANRANFQAFPTTQGNGTAAARSGSGSAAAGGGGGQNGAAAGNAGMTGTNGTNDSNNSTATNPPNGGNAATAGPAGASSPLAGTPGQAPPVQTPGAPSLAPGSRPETGNAAEGGGTVAGAGGGREYHDRTGVLNYSSNSLPPPPAAKKKSGFMGQTVHEETPAQAMHRTLQWACLFLGLVIAGTFYYVKNNQIGMPPKK
jgi:hypothetical protein